MTEQKGAISMKNLIATRWTKYVRSAFFWLGALISLGCGFIAALMCGEGIEKEFLDFNMVYSPLDDFYVLISIWTMIVVTALCAGREFSDGTIRNKLMVGYTKTQVLLSEAVISVMTGFLYCLLFLIPFVCLCALPFYKLLPTQYAVEWTITLFGIYFAFALLTTVLCYLIANRAVGVVIAFGISFGLYFFGYVCSEYFYNDGPEYSYGVDTWWDEATGEMKTEEYTEHNRYYLPDGIRKDLVYIEHYINPTSALTEIECFYYYIDKTKVDTAFIKEEKRQLQRLGIASWRCYVYGIVITLIGVLLFRKRNLK